MALHVLVVGCAAALAGCVSPPPPEEMARTTLQTAPADLQLICANAVAGSAKTESTKVLPMNSRQIDAQTYSVELDAGGRRFDCVVDNNGSVKSVQPV
ncbi:hypothetical protein [Sinorhizobium sp. BG8]|uniref:hypothetical protein n=1 Tax=Sinorhizobium sp. BG8 TaxID=2613773 RepID=UPI00193DE719|nr:hypothetical protein [Sinorhizobium sp. BG8]QRM54169.1 hypothetical protein F3Y30_06090 [Sinorhizobium sp. BG8]